jgi:HSP20 family protein
MSSKEKKQSLTENKKVEIEKHKTVPESSFEEERWFMPLTDYYEDEGSFYLKMEMPGVAEKDVEMDIYDDELIVTGRIRKTTENEECSIYSEYLDGSYHRHFAIMDGVDRPGVKAKIKDGLLTVTLPKKEEYKPRKVLVEAG